MMKVLVAAVLVVAVAVGSVEGLRNGLTMKEDPRSAFFVENFGYEAGGVLEVVVHPGVVREWVENGVDLGAGDSDEYPMGFAILETRSDSADYVDEYGTNCFAYMVPEEDRDRDLIPLTNVSLWASGVHYRREIQPGEEGLYNLFWYNCMPSSTVSLKVDVVMYNNGAWGQNYLSAGKSILPTLYVLFTCAHVVLVCALAFFMSSDGAVVYKVHYFMLVVGILKSLTLLVTAIRYHIMKTTGHGSGWNVIFYILKGLTGLLLFTLIALVGTGWAFVKAYLTDRDKKVVLVVIPLQLLSNIALIMVDEMQPGSRSYLTWYDILRIVDIVCCGLILFPIVWSIKHLQDASTSDGKSRMSAEKLKIFRYFYMLVVAWIYFTRIIVYMLEATVPFRYIWISTLATLASTFAFYAFAGYKFRPVPNNPYLHIGSDDDDDVADIELGDLDNGSGSDDDDVVVDLTDL